MYITNKGTRMKIMTLRMDEKIFEEIKAIAAAEDRSVNKAIVQAIKQYIKENK